MGLQLDGQVAVITGAGSGLGRAAALALAAEGCRIAAVSRTTSQLEEVIGEVRERGSDGIAVSADVQDSAAMEALYKDVEKKWNRCDIVFANAGVNGVWAPLDELTLEEWNKTLSINLTGTFLTVKYALPLLRRQGGSIIITSSVNGTRMFSNTGATAYSCSKAAQVAFAKMTALELAKDHIRVNVICPGAIQSEIDENTQQRHLDEIRTPVKFPVGQIPLTGGKAPGAEEVGKLVLFLASSSSQHVSGTEIFIDGAQSLLQG